MKPSAHRLASLVTLALVAAALSPAACGSVDNAHDLFSGVGNGAGGGGGAGSSGPTTGSTSSASGGGSTSSSPSSVTATTGAGTTGNTVTASTGGDVCGDGLCGATEAQTCPQDCVCAHGVCDEGGPLMDGCDPCVSTVCSQDPFCCQNEWDNQCVQAASNCGITCCGNGSCDVGESCSCADCAACACGDGVCDGETCDSCAMDCGACAPDPTCPHTVCFVSNEPLDTINCHDPCVETVCQMQPSCCQPSPPQWDASCTNLSISLCGADPCVEAVCAAIPSCCTGAWTQACVDQAKASCQTTCDCEHSVCESGAKLVIGCNPCVDEICAADPYCCEAGWDGICTNWAGPICGIDCG